MDEQNTKPLSAAEIRKITIEAANKKKAQEDSRIQKELVNLTQKILTQAASGYTSLKLNYVLDASLIKALKDLGYEVTCHAYRDYDGADRMSEISW